MDWLFYIFAAITLLSGLMVVAGPSRNPITSAMFLVITMIGMSGLFVLLQAYFLAAIQLLVYAGAVMVLFLFVIMLLNLGEEEKRRWNLFALGTGSVASIGLVVILWHTIWGKHVKVPNVDPGSWNVKQIGTELFTNGQYLLPFELVSLLLLAAMMGVILLSKKELK